LDALSDLGHLGRGAIIAGGKRPQQLALSYARSGLCRLRRDDRTPQLIEGLPESFSRGSWSGAAMMQDQVTGQQGRAGASLTI